MEKEDKKSAGNQSLLRGLNLLEILSDYPNGCPLAKLSELAKLNKSTTHRMLQSLQACGYVKPANVSGSYRLTTKCLMIGQKTLNSLNILNVIAPYLEQLNLETGETVNFSMRDGDFATMIHKLDPTSGVMRTRSYIGQRIRLYCSAMGKNFMAYDKEEEVAQYWQRQEKDIVSLTANTITELPRMYQTLATIRAQGFALDDEENELGVTCLSCPIFDVNGKVNYAVSVSLSTARLAQIGRDSLLQQLQRVADEISQELGGGYLTH